MGRRILAISAAVVVLLVSVALVGLLIFTNTETTGIDPRRDHIIELQRVGFAFVGGNVFEFSRVWALPAAQAARVRGVEVDLFGGERGPHEPRTTAQHVQGEGQPGTRPVDPEYFRTALIGSVGHPLQQRRPDGGLQQWIPPGRHEGVVQQLDGSVLVAHTSDAGTLCSDPFRAEQPIETSSFA